MTRRQFMSVIGLAGGITSFAQQPNVLPIQGREHSVPVVGADGAVAYRFRSFSGVVEVDLGGNERLELSCIPGGSGQIGTTDPWSGFTAPQPGTTPVRIVTIAPFCLGCYEVTQGQWLRVSQLPRVHRDLRIWFVRGRSPDELRYPVDEGISFEQVEEFCARLQRLSGLAFRAPSEAEWEYACRAGTTTRYFFGAVEHREFTRLGRFTTVGSRDEPNRYRLYDLHGGASEWCADWSHDDYRGAPLDGRPWINSGNSDLRMVRGGSLMGSGSRSYFHRLG
ncbi:MAG: formylglycine-generating enzyme family protein [Bryobacteraceae bacterium]|nr:formylglycine-generating enzyme family protein [Bryobacteraceae bacterium]